MKTSATKRLTIDISRDEHMKLRLASSIEGISMKEFILRNVFSDPSNKKILSETEYLLSGKNKGRLLKSVSSKKSKTFSSFSDLKHAFGV